jgi:FlaA1/EpsC-like NDP-sugar epimerase
MDVEGVDFFQLLGRPRLAIPTGPALTRLRSERVLITGAGGSLGSALTVTLARAGVSGLGLLDHHENSLFELRQRLGREAPDARPDFFLVDIRNRGRLERVLRLWEPTVVYHLAAFKHVPTGEEFPEEVVATNVLGTRNLLAAMSPSVRRFVFSSTDKVVNPAGVYGASKRLVELMLLARSREVPTEFAILRLVNTVGARGGVIRTFISQLRAGLPVTVTDPEMTRYWIAFPEAVDFLVWGGGDPAARGVFVLELGPPVRLGDTVERLARMLGVDAPAVRVTGPRPGEKLAEELIYPGEVTEDVVSGVIRRVATGEPPVSAAELADLIRRLECLVEAGDGAGLRAALFEAVRAGIPGRFG